MTNNLSIYNTLSGQKEIFKSLHYAYAYCNSIIAEIVPNNPVFSPENYSIVRSAIECTLSFFLPQKIEKSHLSHPDQNLLIR